jgi:hypothetical protein
MFEDMQTMERAQQTSVVLRTYVLPNIFRALAIALGIGLGYLIGNA